MEFWVLCRETLVWIYRRWSLVPDREAWWSDLFSKVSCKSWGWNHSGQDWQCSPQPRCGSHPYWPSVVTSWVQRPRWPQCLWGGKRALTMGGHLVGTVWYLPVLFFQEHCHTWTVESLSRMTTPTMAMMTSLSTNTQIDMPIVVQMATDTLNLVQWLAWVCFGGCYLQHLILEAHPQEKVGDFRFCLVGMEKREISSRNLVFCLMTRSPACPWFLHLSDVDWAAASYSGPQCVCSIWCFPI